MLADNNSATNRGSPLLNFQTFHSNQIITMFEFIYDYVERETFIKYFRLTVVVSVYILARKLYSNFAKDALIKRQIAIDEKEKLEKPAKEQAKLEEREKKLEAEAKSFGWGKKTRRNVKLQEKVLNDTIDELRFREQGAYDAAEDHDIEDLLED